MAVQCHRHILADIRVDIQWKDWSLLSMDEDRSCGNSALET